MKKFACCAMLAAFMFVTPAAQAREGRVLRGAWRVVQILPAVQVAKAVFGHGQATQKSAVQKSAVQKSAVQKSAVQKSAVQKSSSNRRRLFRARACSSGSCR